MATKALLGDTYRYEKASANRDSYLAKLGIHTYLVVADGADDKPKKIKFKTDPFATLPRVASAPVNSVEGSTHRENNSSLDSLYEKLPASLPVTSSYYRNPTTSLPHIYTVGYRNFRPTI